MSCISPKRPMGCLLWVQILSYFPPFPLSGRDKMATIFKCSFLNEYVWIWIRISLKFVPKFPVDNTPALVQITAWHLLGAKPLSEPIMVLLMHICIVRPQWINCALPRLTVPLNYLYLCSKINWWRGDIGKLEQNPIKRVKTTTIFTS